MRDLFAIFFLFSCLALVTCDGESQSDAPGNNPSSRAIFIVSKDGTGDYTTIQAAVDNSKPGDTIHVKTGVYNEGVSFTKSGTSTQPITLMNYPGHSPVIDPGGGTYPQECCPSSGPLRVELRAEWIILEGFEIRYGWDGVKVFKPHNTIINNWIHHNRYQGILIISTNDILIEGNAIEYNGTDPGACYDSSWGGVSPRHCHGIYMSDYSCTGLSNITIRRNVISGHSGRGVLWNGLGCGSKSTNTVVDSNLIENNSWGLALYHNVENAKITNNTFINDSRPDTDDVAWTFLGVWESRSNTITNNEFHTSLPDFAAIHVYDSESMDNDVNHNLWRTAGSLWIWDGQKRTDWENYRDVSGWDSESDICIGCDNGT